MRTIDGRLRPRSEILFALGWPDDGDRALEVARELVDRLDASTGLDAWYPDLLKHKTLLIALDLLERAGADPRCLTISGRVFATTWPLNVLLPAPTEVAPGRVALDDIRTRVLHHHELLSDLLVDLLDRESQILLQFGIGLQAAYPAYRHGISHDLDLMVPRVAAASALVEALWDEQGFVLTKLRMSRAPQGWIAQYSMAKLTEERYQVSLGLMARGRPSGPRFLPAFVHPAIFDRARELRWGGRSVLVPSAEDMLLLLSDKVQRRRNFVLRNYNDARFLLRLEGSAIDWDYVVGTASSFRIGGVLLHLIEVAEHGEERALIPDSVRAGLTPGDLERRLVGAAGMPIPGKQAPALPMPLARAWRLWTDVWFWRSVADRWTSARDLLNAARDLFQGLALRLELRPARSGMTRRLRRLAPGRRWSLEPGFVPNRRAMRSAGRPPSDPQD